MMNQFKLAVEWITIEIINLNENQIIKDAKT